MSSSTRAPLVAYLNRQDPLHGRAVELVDRVLKGKHGVALSVDLVVSEGLTLLRRRPRRRDVSTAFPSLFRPHAGRSAVVQLRFTEPRLFDAAATLHFEHYDRGPSFVDCALAAHAASTRSHVATFDQRLARIVPALDA